MRESNFSNPTHNRACLTISPAVYDRRAIDCTATLPLINSLNHLAYLTSTSPRIREMVTLDGGLERLIRILRQVPKAPTPASIRGGATKEMQAIWKWTLAFQCVVNVGVRGSEAVRTRVVEAGMVPVTVRVLESYLRMMEAAREERRREILESKLEARAAEAREALANGRDVETSPSDSATYTVPTRPTSRRGAVSGAHRSRPSADPHDVFSDSAVATNNDDTDSAGGSGDAQHLHAGTTETRPTTPAEADVTDLSIVSASTSASAAAGAPRARRPMVPVLPNMDGMPLDSDSASLHSGISPSTSTSSVMPASESSHTSYEVGHLAAAAGRSGTLTNASSVEDFGVASGSGSDGAEDAEMFGAEDVGEDEAEDRRTPRPARRVLAPLSSTDVQPIDFARGAEAGPSVASVEMAHRQDTVTPRNRGQATDVAGLRTARPAAQQVQTQEWSAATAAVIAAERRSNRSHRSGSLLDGSPNGDMIYREEEVLLSLQLLAYLSKYAHVRALFHSSDLSSPTALDEMDILLAGDSINGDAAETQRNRSWHPEQRLQRNVFSVAERYTLRSSRSSPTSALHPRLAPEIQYWAGVIMRNACRKDESRGGIRQCANMLCGKWESFPREFAKCRRCRKAKYCSKQCQSKGWQMGHRFWCSAKDHDGRHEHEGDKTREEDEQHPPQVVDLGGAGGTGPAQQAAPVGPVVLDDRGDDFGQRQQQVRRRRSDARQAEVDAAATPRHSQFPHPGDDQRQQAQQEAQQAGPSHRTHPRLSAILSSDDATGSRPGTSHSSGAETSDVSDEETTMARASWRVTASMTAAPVRRPSETRQAHRHRHRRDDEDEEQHAIGIPTPAPRTDLAGRPLPPPVIAQHDAALMGLQGPGDAELLALATGGRMTPGGGTREGADETDVLFGRGDIDQMIWRGRTPAPDDDVDGDDAEPAAAAAAARAQAHHHRLAAQTAEGHVARHRSGSVSHVDSAASAPDTMAGTSVPRYPSSMAAAAAVGLRAPVPRSAQRFTSVNVGGPAGSAHAGASHSLSDLARPASETATAGIASFGSVEAAEGVAGLGFDGGASSRRYHGLESRRVGGASGSGASGLFSPASARAVSGFASAPSHAVHFGAEQQPRISSPLAREADGFASRQRSLTPAGMAYLHTRLNEEQAGGVSPDLRTPRQAFADVVAEDEPYGNEMDMDE